MSSATRSNGFLSAPSFERVLRAWSSLDHARVNLREFGYGELLPHLDAIDRALVAAASAWRQRDVAAFEGHVREARVEMSALERGFVSRRDLERMTGLKYVAQRLRRRLPSERPAGEDSSQ